MKDFLGQELFVGDNIVMIESSYGNSAKTLIQAKITALNKTMVSTTDGAKHPSKILKIDTILNNIQNQKNNV